MLLAYLCNKVSYDGYASFMARGVLGFADATLYEKTGGRQGFILQTFDRLESRASY